MKKAKTNPHDILYLTLSLLLIFTVAIHITSEKERAIVEDAVIFVRLEKSRGDLEKAKNVMVDERISAQVLFATERYAVLFCHGRQKNGVFFLGGAKTLCENQPICFYSALGGAEGRIERILFTKVVKNT